MTTPTRSLATVERITALAPVPGADRIVAATVRGWQVVVGVDDFTAGDLCVYFEIDSLLDVTDPRFAFLAPRGVRTTPEGARGHVLRTMRLRGQVSQGLALPLRSFAELAGTPVGTDVTAALGVTRWDPPLPAVLVGAVRGRLPGWIPTIDEVRVQNTPELLTATGHRWVATEKVDGTSTTFYVDPDAGSDGGVDGVCSRNLDVLETPESVLWQGARRLDVHARLRAGFAGRRVAVQGETYGEGVQGNPLRVRGVRFAAFTLLVDGTEVPRDAWPAWLLQCAVPVHEHLRLPQDVAQALADVDRLESLLAPGRPAEGVVWRAADSAVAHLPDGRRPRASFKVISNRYLLKHDR